MKVYQAIASGNSYKVRILLALLKVPHESVMIDLAAGEHKQPAFTALNPRGEIPVIEDEGRLFWDSAACLAYIARKHGGEQWLPSSPAGIAEVMQWLALSASEIQFGLQYGRRGATRGIWTVGGPNECQTLSRIALDAMERRLKDHDWLALDRPTIADVSCFPYVETAAESKVDLAPWPAVRAWLDRCRALPGWPARG